MLMNSRGGSQLWGCKLMNSKVDERTPFQLIKPRGGPPLQLIKFQRCGPPFGCCMLVNWLMGSAFRDNFYVSYGIFFRWARSSKTPDLPKFERQVYKICLFGSSKVGLPRKKISPARLFWMPSWFLILGHKTNPFQMANIFSAPLIFA